MKEKLFKLTEGHLKLMRRMYVGWQDCEFGAPEIDPKRPYGNSDVIDDIKEIIGGHITDDQAEELHKETETALQICLTMGEFKPGLFKQNDSYRWIKA